ncbi:uncharacterized protein EDB91DRAFT_381959 [Suillus paluster]|uniref:uncharacterized protein n=1 Tax=Suillus paluster TaxID=48578 RepID=UPI001B86E652|nr:uncharacterized protein EDB91DRAFT_381959 [Suillus paluster]KAG1739400.1 hypothetical protein EDB91DRAFT_381959 [Suillus paluster]
MTKTQALQLQPGIGAIVAPSSCSVPSPFIRVYSADAVTAARSLQTYTYIYTSAATFWTYDYACSLHQELGFLLRSRWTKVKGLYIVTRYTSFSPFRGTSILELCPQREP